MVRGIFIKYHEIPLCWHHPQDDDGDGDWCSHSHSVCEGGGRNKNKQCQLSNNLIRDVVMEDGN